jgi:hypothetical protein
VRYQKVSTPLPARIPDEFCQVCRYNRKYAIRLLNGPTPQKPKTIARKGRPSAYIEFSQAFAVAEKQKYLAVLDGEITAANTAGASAE